MNVLITCCGRKLYLIDEFRKALATIRPGEKHCVFTTEADPHAASLMYADEGFVVPLIHDPRYVDVVAELCRRWNIGLLLPTKDTELRLFSAAADRFPGVSLPLAGADVLEACEDKLRFFDAMKNTFTLPTTVVYSDWSPSRLPPPVVVKERGLGVETSGHSLCRSVDEVNAAAAKLVSPIVQQHVAGDEYTVDCLIRRDGRPIVIIPRRRLRLRANTSDVGLVVADPTLIQATSNVARQLGLVGPNNVQWIRDAAAGNHLLEVNPRISGGLQFALAACPGFFTAMVREALGESTDDLSFDAPLLCAKHDVIVCRKVS